MSELKLEERQFAGNSFFDFSLMLMKIGKFRKGSSFLHEIDCFNSIKSGTKIA